MHIRFETNFFWARKLGMTHQCSLWENIDPPSDAFLESSLNVAILYGQASGRQ